MADPDDPTPCAVRSRERGEPITATASRVRRWLVVEQPGAWGHSAVRQSRLDPRIGDQLQRRARRLGVRVLLARRPGWTAPEPGAPRSVFAAHSGRTDRWLERAEVHGDAELLELDLEVLSSAEPPGLGVLVTQPIVLVCTHGRHDACCANLGRPVVRALHAAGVPDVWECSHIGGDRFAANLVALPSGVYLGRVPPERAADIVADLAGDLIDIEHYRGRSCYATLAQAAEIAARQHLGERRVDALGIERVDAAGDTASVVLSHHTGRLEVVVRRHATGQWQLSCGAGNGTTWRYEVVAVGPAG